MTSNLQNPSAKLVTRLVGLDYGMKRIGVALSDESKMIASPLTTFSVDSKSEDTVVRLLQQLIHHAEKNGYDIETIVIGMPLMMSGKRGLIADEVSHFVDIMRKHTEIPLVLWDERLSSVQAERTLRESSMSRKKRSQVVDVVAASIILQNYLDHRKIKMEQQLTQNGL